ncbi:hypothetical protein [Dysgonomonas macrotermitis]|uniref:LPP20 lipoprotein n=1 Tax=Dysgonomonas macrotermitis TaxID=1346286 RepID=A0A1M4SI45_9BACT|nr:hypothetical protein [Dysgonomonas macrotermitis]SHE31934.1 hypothetical protein SAMN05444362_10171 [Dysgonomonas macrotermitis]
MKKLIYNIGVLMLVLTLITSCGSSQKTVGAHYTSETECLGVEGDGSQTVRAWGTGRNKTDAVEQARKNAVRDILFKGITKGTGECNMKPLLLEVNAQEKYEYYFNIFFQDGGAYKQYVSNEDTRSGSSVSSSTDTQVKYGVVVRVLRSELKERLINDQILKP